MTDQENGPLGSHPVASLIQSIIRINLATRNNHVPRLAPLFKQGRHNNQQEGDHHVSNSRKTPSESLNGKSHSPRNETAAPEAAADPPRIIPALNAVDRMMRDARIVRTLEIAIAREERERDQKIALFDDLEDYYLDDLACLADEIAAHGAQIARFRGLVRVLKGEGWAHA